MVISSLISYWLISHGTFFAIHMVLMRLKLVDSIDQGLCLQVVQHATGAPGPGSQYAPVIDLACLAFIDQTDDALSQACTVVALDA